MISEIDLQDWEKGEVTELYNVPRDTWVQEVDSGFIFKFGHIDGMYSFCHDQAGNVVHIKAWTEVFPLKEKE